MIKIDENQGLSWDYLDWLDKFNYLVKNDLPTDDLRVSAYKNTIRTIENNGYFIDDELLFVLGRPKSKYYDKVDNVVLDEEIWIRTKVTVINGDLLDVAGLLKKSKLNPVVINVVNPRNPGGGVTTGMQGTEEDIFIRTNISSSLYQFSDVGKLYGIDKSDCKYKYPLTNDKHGIYTEDVRVFKGNIETGYKLLRRPYDVSIISIPAIVRPKLEFVNGRYLIANPFLEKIKNRIKTALRIAVHEGHDSLVLNGFGSTAIKNPPEHIAELLSEIFSDSEFFYKFKSIVFAINDDPKIREEYNPEGDFMPFFKTFM